MNSKTIRMVSEQVRVETEAAQVQVELINGQVQEVRLFYKPQDTAAWKDTVLISSFGRARKPTREQIVERLAELGDLFHEAATTLDAYEEVA